MNFPSRRIRIRFEQAGILPPVNLSGKHNKHDSIFSVTSVSSFGSVIDNGTPDSFGYGRHSRPPSEDMPISMSMSVDDTFSFVYRKRHSRMDSDASSFYFRSQPSVIGPLRRRHRARDSINPPVVPLLSVCTTVAITDVGIVEET